MRTAKRILTLFMVMVMAMTAFSVTVSAASIADTAIAITSGKTVKTTLRAWEGDVAEYKINVNTSGDLKLNITTCMEECVLKLYDSDGNMVKPTSHTSISGSVNIDEYKTELRWNKSVEKYSGTIIYSVKKGAYYISLSRWSSYTTGAGGKGDGTVTFSATVPSSSTSTGKVSYLTLTMSKGWSLQLGAVVSPSGKKVTWKSSKKSVVSVSSNGLITAKKKGTAIITAKCGSSTKKIKIIVK